MEALFLLPGQLPKPNRRLNPNTAQAPLLHLPQPERWLTLEVVIRYRFSPQLSGSAVEGAVYCLE